MKNHFALCLCGMLTVALGSGCASYRNSEEHANSLGAPVIIEKTPVGFDRSEAVTTGLLVPNSNGKTMIIPGPERPPLNPLTEEAYELKLKTRELAAQLFETRDNNTALLGLVAMPTSFVDLNNLNDSNPLGRYLAEAMFYECNQRDFPVREYRLRGNIRLKEGTGELALSRELSAISTKQSWAALLVGTYFRDASAVFVNARLVRPSDGLVLRTAHVVLPNNGIMDRMIPAPTFPTGTLRITSKK